MSGEWENYLTHKEAERIISEMIPKAPWTKEQWESAMEQHGFQTENEPCYNKCALWTTMSMIMSDSAETLAKYTENGKLFSIVHDLAVDKLTDEDKRFNIRKYFNT